MRYRVRVPGGETVPPLHDTEDDKGYPTDPAHLLSIDDPVEVDGEITGKVRVKVTTVEASPRTGWFAAAALEPWVPDPDIKPGEFYNSLNLQTVGKTDQRYLFSLAVAESGLKNAPSSISGSDGFGPFQYTSAKWEELLTSAGTDTDLKSKDRFSHEGQAKLAIAEAVAAMKRAETALSRPVLRNELYLLHLLPTSAADAFLKAVKEAPTTPIDTILTGVPDAAKFVEQHSRLIKNSDRTATVAEALDLAASALQPGLDKTVELYPPPQSLLLGCTVFEAKCLRFMRPLMAKFQLSAEQAAGVFGNLGTESDGFTAFHEYGQPKGKGGYGWAQWTSSPRREGFFTYATDNGYDPASDEASYGYLCQELETTEKSTIAALRATEVNTIEKAVDVFEENYERAGKPNMPSRYEWARKAFAVCTHPHPPDQSFDPGATAGPKWVKVGINNVGFHEVGDNRGIEEFIKQAKCGRLGDPWCAIWANAKLEESGIQGTRSALARSFCNNPNFGKLKGPALGAIVVFWRESQDSGKGHVGFYMGETPTHILTLGGNEGDMVQQQFEPNFQLLGYWWPKLGAEEPQMGVITATYVSRPPTGKVT
jgi:uncharacterized protein (TIGR02594 family)